MQFDLIAHLTRQAAFSRATFGPGRRTAGVLDHIEEEMEEVRTAQSNEERQKEWTDLVILSLDGLLREIRESLTEDRAERLRAASMSSHFQEAVGNAADPVTNDEIARIAVEKIVGKQGVNETRDYPDWRQMSGDKRINHVRREEDD